jgi:hypothetical protein
LVCLDFFQDCRLSAVLGDLLDVRLVEVASLAGGGSKDALDNLGAELAGG